MSEKPTPGKNRIWLLPAALLPWLKQHYQFVIGMVLIPVAGIYYQQSHSDDEPEPIQGTVKDSIRETSLEKVTVIILEEMRRTHTDAAGNFSISAENLPAHINMQFIKEGFERKQAAISLPIETRLEITLAPDEKEPEKPGGGNPPPNEPLSGLIISLKEIHTEKPIKDGVITKAGGRDFNSNSSDANGIATLTFNATQSQYTEVNISHPNYQPLYKYHIDIKNGRNPEETIYLTPKTP